MLGGIGASAAYAVVTRDVERLQQRFEDRADNVRDANRFRERAAGITDAESLIKDRKSLKMVLEAYGLEAAITSTAMVRKALTEDPAVEGSLVNKLADPRWRQLAQALGGKDGSLFADQQTVEAILDQAMTRRFEQELGDENPGVSEALYFRRLASGATSINAILSDRTLTEVVRGALGLPDKFGLLDFDQQKAILTKRLEVADLQDAKEVDKLARRYLALNGASAGGDPSGLSALFGQGSGTQGLTALLGQTLSLRA